MKATWLIVMLLSAGGFFLAGWWYGTRASVEPAHPTLLAPHATSRDLEQSLAQCERRVAQLKSQLEMASQVRTDRRDLSTENASDRSAPSMVDLLALQPAPFPMGDWRRAERVFEDCWFSSPDGLRLHGWYARRAQPRAVVLYLHGNAGNITYRGGIVAMLRERLRVSVLLFDYRGYGRSEGRPTLGGVVLDAHAARDYLARREGVEPSDIVLLGRSLGGGIAVQLAADDGARALVLESTFASLRQAVTAFYPAWAVNVLVADKLNSEARIGEYEGPLLMSHGDADRTIPYQQARHLFQQANEPKTFVRIAGGDHNDPQTAEYYRQFEKLIDNLPR